MSPDSMVIIFDSYHAWRLGFAFGGGIASGVVLFLATVWALDKALSFVGGKRPK